MKAYYKRNNFFFILFILFSFFKASNLLELSLFLPNSLQLLDLSNVIVASDGIHFYNQDLTIEYTNKKKELTLEESGLDKVAMAQFSSEHGGYIIILVNDVIYLYGEDKNFMKSQDLSEIINEKYYSLIPYKKNNNNLIFYITYLCSDTNNNNEPLNIVKFNFDLSNIDSGLTYQKKIFPVYKDETTTTSGFKALSCLLMSPPSTLSFNNEILTCFCYVDYPPSLFANSYNPEEDLQEIPNFKHFQRNTGFDYYPNFNCAKTNRNKKKVLICSEFNIYLYWATYDYTNQFSPLYKETSGEFQIASSFVKNKMFYFEHSNEFVTVSGNMNDGCDKFVMVFKNYRLYYKGILSFPDHNNGCSNTKSFTAYYNGLNYTILEDNGQQLSWNKLVDELVCIEIDNIVSDYIEEESILTTIITLEPPTTITTTYLEPPTTITTTYLEPPTTITTTYLEPPTTITTTYLEPPTTITTTYLEPPTTIITTYLELPTTIITTYLEPPTTIITTLIETPTTIITTYIDTLTTVTTTQFEPPTTIFTTYLEPKTTVTTTYLENPTTISTTYIESLTTIISTYLQPQIITTTYLETPSTIITTYLNPPTTTYSETPSIASSTLPNNMINFLNNTKCKTSSEESALYNLCTSCNNDENFFAAYFPENDFLHHFTECYNKTTKPKNFYFDEVTQQFKPCYETCSSCDKGGNYENNNCITCDVNYIKKPGYLNSSNCVTKCFYYYYYSPYGQYKCTNSSKCPKEAPLFIKDLKKCTSDCNKEGIYKYQYGGQCLKDCPKATSAENNICISNLNFCTKTENEIDLNGFNTSFKEVDSIAKDYVIEFRNTGKHVSYYNDSLYSVIIYKDINCIDELEINMAKIDFGECYSKILENLNPPTSENIVMALIEKESEDKKSIISYSFYHPETGIKIGADNICKDEEIIIKENVLSMIDKTDVDLDSVLHLTQQNINIFNLSDDFYTDICYDFVSPNGKDVPLKDRIKAYYPNITLCDTGCNSKGVNLTTLESICECKFNELIKNEIIEGNAFIQNAIGGITDIIYSSNILVLQCYKNVINKKYIIKGYGAFIIMFIVFIQIIFSFVFFLGDMSNIRRYLFNLTEYFLLFINKNKNRFSIINKNISNSSINKIKSPPKRTNAIKKKTEKPIKKKREIRCSRDPKKKRTLNDNSKSLNSMKSESKLIMGKSPIIKYPHKNKRRNSNLNLNINRGGLQELIKAKKICGIDMDDYLNTDVDDMDYDDAIKLDKRTFCEFFKEKLKAKQIIINTFCNKENLKPMSIKIILLFLNFDLYFVINGLFFDDEFLSSLFNSDEKETFFSFVPRSISRFYYIIIVGAIVGIIVDCIFFEERKIKRIFKREKGDPIQLRYEISLAVKSIKSRYAVFIIICIFISAFSWYYISCFNNTYPGVKIEWIKSSILNIIIMQILYILIALLQAILRELSFYYKSEKLFKLQSYI